MNRIPMFFIHVVTGSHFRITLAEVNSQFGIAFNVEMCGIGNAGKQEEFFADFKNQGILTERQAFSYARLCEAIVAYFFNIHRLETPDQFVKRGNVAEHKFNPNNDLPVLVGSVVFEFGRRVVITIKAFAKYKIVRIAKVNSHIRLFEIVIKLKLITKPERHNNVYAAIGAWENISKRAIQRV